MRGKAKLATGHRPLGVEQFVRGAAGAAVSQLISQSVKLVRAGREREKTDTLELKLELLEVLS